MFDHLSARDQYNDCYALIRDLNNHPDHLPMFEAIFYAYPEHIQAAALATDMAESDSPALKPHVYYDNPFFRA